jgi:hypothetical protein
MLVLRPRFDSIVGPQLAISHARLVHKLRTTMESGIPYRKSTALVGVGGLILRVRQDYARRNGY